MIVGEEVEREVRGISHKNHSRNRTVSNRFCRRRLGRRSHLLTEVALFLPISRRAPTQPLLVPLGAMQESAWDGWISGTHLRELLRRGCWRSSGNGEFVTFVSYAQNFEDVMLWRALRHVESGFYIDVGAAHPDDYSVTRAFYDRGWSGINVEPTSRVTQARRGAATRCQPSRGRRAHGGQIDALRRGGRARTSPPSIP